MNGIVISPIAKIADKCCRNYYDWIGSRWNPSVRKPEELFPLKKVLFEGSYFWAPANSEAYLTRMYGDYMKLPKLDNLKKHTVL